METERATRRSLLARLFAFGTELAQRYDRKLLVAFFLGLFALLFAVQPVLQGLSMALDAWLGDSAWNSIITSLAAAGLVVFLFFPVSPAILVWLERKLSGHIQSRYGPMHVGAWHGWLQTIADGIKLLLKEDIVPEKADKALHLLAPLIVLIITATAFVVIPFGNELIPADLNIGLFYLLAVTSVGVFGIVLAGYASGNKYSLLGGMRSAAQLVSYEIPRALAVLGVVMMAGTFKMSTIVGIQAGKPIYAQGVFQGAEIGIPFIIYQPIAFILFIVASIAETNRTPFDLPEAESELVAGFHTEYSGMKFAFFFMAEYGNMILFCCLGTALFLGGGAVPFIDGYLQAGINKISTDLFGSYGRFLQGFWHFPLFIIKTYLLVFLFIWVRWTYPRIRVDRLMDFAWKVLLPWALANILLLGIAMLYENQGGLCVFAVVNWALVVFVLYAALKPSPAQA